MIATTTINRHKLAILGGVVALHVLVLWVLQSAWIQRPAQEVIALQMVNPPIAPPEPALAQRPVVRQRSAKQPSKVTMQAIPLAVQTDPLPPHLPLILPGTSTAATQSTPMGPAGGPALGLAGNAANSTLVNGSGAVSATQALAEASSPPRIELPSSDADYLHNPKPEYPRLSRQRNEQGKTVVRVLIGRDGLPQKAEVKVSSGFERLDAAALATVMAWRYVPGKRGGVPEAMWFFVPIQFVMN